MRPSKQARYSAVPVAVSVEEAFGGDEENDLLGGDDLGGGGAKADIPMDPPVSVTDLERKCLQVGKPCWGCDYHFGPGGGSGQTKGQIELWKEVERNKGTMEPTTALCEHIQKAWVELIYVPQTDLGKILPYWSVDDIRCHLKYHLNDPKLSWQTQLREYDIILNEIKQSLFRKHSSGVVYTDELQLKAYVAICTLKDKSLKLGLEFQKN